MSYVKQSHYKICVGLHYSVQHLFGNEIFDRRALAAAWKSWNFTPNARLQRPTCQTQKTVYSIMTSLDFLQWLRNI